MADTVDAIMVVMYTVKKDRSIIVYRVVVLLLLLNALLFIMALSVSGLSRGLVTVPWVEAL